MDCELELKGYQNIQFSNEGDWKTIYQAHDNYTNLKVALKRYKKLTEDKLERLWERERLDVESMRRSDVSIMRLKHPNIPQCSWTFDDKGNFYIIEPWLDMTLEQLVLNKSHLSHSEFMLYASGIAAGLSCCHKNGIIHGDIKMDNIGIMNRKAVLCDFGIASFISPIRRKRYNPGTIRTRAPELFGKGVSITENSDIWAVGCVLFAMLTGDYPFFNKEEQIPPWDMETARREFEQRKREEILKGQSTFYKRIRDEVSELYWEILESCLQYDPNKRVTSSGLVSVLRRVKAKIRKYIEAMKREQQLVQKLEKYGNLKVYFLYYIEEGTSHHHIEWPGGKEVYSFFPGDDVSDYLPFLTFENWRVVTPRRATAYASRMGQVHFSSYAKEILTILH